MDTYYLPNGHGFQLPAAAGLYTLTSKMAQYAVMAVTVNMLREKDQ